MTCTTPIHLAELQEQGRWVWETYVLTSFLLGVVTSLPAIPCFLPSHSNRTSPKENNRDQFLLFRVCNVIHTQEASIISEGSSTITQNSCFNGRSGAIYYGSIFWVLSDFTLLLKLIFPQPEFTGCLARGRNWHVSWFSHLCLLSPQKWGCIQNKLFWKHILSIQALLQDLTTENTSRILLLGSSWMGAAEHYAQYLLKKT